MRKLTMLAVVVAIMAAAVVSIVPALRLAGHSLAIGEGDTPALRCAQRSARVACTNGGDTCDLTTALRGSVRLASGELCKSQPTAPGCQLASVAGLKKR